MCVGEGAGLVTTQPKSAQILNIDVPFDGLGLISIPASETISPVFTMWITLVAMYTGTTVCSSPHVEAIVLSYLDVEGKGEWLHSLPLAICIRSGTTCVGNVMHPASAWPVPSAWSAAITADMLCLACRARDQPSSSSNDNCLLSEVVVSYLQLVARRL